MIQTAMILAAGRGTRMQHLTDTRPKPLVRVAGKTLLDAALDKAVAAGVQNVVVNVCYLGEQIERALANRPFPIHFSREETALETGGGILNALPVLCQNGGEEGFFALNADTLWDDKTISVFDHLRAAWNPDCMDALLALIPIENTFGDVKDGNYFIENGRPRRQKPGETNIPYVFMGVQILHPRLFSGMTPGVFSVRDLYDKAQQNGRLSAVIHDGRWFHVGTPAAVIQAESLLCPTTATKTI